MHKRQVDDDWYAIVVTISSQLAGDGLNVYYNAEDERKAGDNFNIYCNSTEDDEEVDPDTNERRHGS